MLGIPTYQPKFHITAAGFRDEFQEILSTLIGKPIDRFWLMWDSEQDEWLSDGPIILEIDGHRLELTAYKLSEFSLTINSFEMSEKLDWYGMGDETPLAWKENGKSEMLRNLHKPIIGINILAYNFTNRCAVGNTYAPGMLIGIEFILEKENSSDKKNFFSIFNGLDQNEIGQTAIQQNGEVKRMRI